ncbi:MAG: hypothetical protein PF487_09115 [Bacteroidales bacterium]|jgi:hypothetical protein|nr:hypothetical protein [Bacteroidales bacterium]
MKVLKENNTHKAVEDIGVISIYSKGLNNDDLEFIDKFPHMFEDEFLFNVDYEEDLFAIFEQFEENSRVLFNEANAEFKELC